MRESSIDPPPHSLSDGARSLVLEWLHEDKRDPQFWNNLPDSKLANCHAQIAENFLNRIKRSGFEAELISVHRDGAAPFEVHWTHHGAVFVGFKQAPPAAKAADALLLGCAALLQNDWCRKQLQKQ